jgi:hypothetical protein
MKTYIAYSSTSATITRACVPMSVCKAMSLMVAGYGMVTTCCGTNNCNSAEIKNINLYLLVFPLLYSLIFSKI